MSASTTTMTSSTSVYTTPAFWERLWRTAGIQSALCFIVEALLPVLTVKRSPALPQENDNGSQINGD